MSKMVLIPPVLDKICPPRMFASPLAIKFCVFNKKRCVYVKKDSVSEKRGLWSEIDQITKELMDQIS